jgi:hypothetical protein
MRQIGFTTITHQTMSDGDYFVVYLTLMIAGKVKPNHKASSGLRTFESPGC